MTTGGVVVIGAVVVILGGSSVIVGAVVVWGVDIGSSAQDENTMTNTNNDKKINKRESFFNGRMLL